MRLKNSNIVKIAVEFPEKFPKLIDFNQTVPLSTIIRDLCNEWQLPDSDQYALQLSINDRDSYSYVTEKNRNEIKNGNVLVLTLSASKTAQDILLALNSGTNEQKMRALQQLSKLSVDRTFASEFISKKGDSLIISMIEQRKFQDTMLANCLQSFVELMDHRIVSWDVLEPPFIITVAGYVNNHSRSQDPEIIQAALVILESIVLNSTRNSAQVEKEVTLTNLVVRLESPNSLVQQSALALINALFLKADGSKRKAIASTLWSKQVRQVLKTKIIETDQIKVEMAYQLYVLQTLFLGLLEPRMNTKMDPQDQESHEKIKELRKIAFEMEANGNNDGVNRNKVGTLAKDYKKLGFKSDINPALDFDETPPGMLALDCMYYFAKNHVESYTKVVLENSCRADEHECPFGRTSVELVKLLCQILRIGESLEEQKNTMYYPMFFTHDHPLEELYCTCIVVLNKTWREMRATIEDFTKVFSVVREQIVQSLKSQPMNFDKLKQKLNSLTYSEITNLWQQERTTREKWESHAKPIVQLKEIITPEIVDLIQKQRLGYLVEGTRFTKYSLRSARGKDNKFWYVRLSLNHKMFHYGDCDEKNTPSVEELPNKLQVSDIKALVTGKDCPHIKDNKGGRKTNHNLAFSLTLDSIEVSSVDFIAPDEKVFDYWTDGVNALLGFKMTSKEAENDLEMLLSMEIKLRLLDAVDVNIPQDQPIIPPDPPNYDFALEFK